MENREKFYGMLGLCAKAGKIVSGSEAVSEASSKRKVKLIVLTEDSSERTKEIFQKMGQKEQIPVVIFSKIDELSERIGKQNKAVIGIIDENFAKAMIQILNGGEAIG